MRVIVVLVLVVLVGENKVNSYSDQLKLGQVCKFGVKLNMFGNFYPFLKKQYPEKAMKSFF